jgi:hypothetical protein
VCLGAAWLDIDQDGDLDLVVCQYAATAADALKHLKGEKAPATGGIALFVNIGEAPPGSNPNKQQPPLTCRFRRADKIAVFQGPPDPLTGVVVSDVRGGRQLDLVTLADGAPPGVILNDRLLRFRRTGLPEPLTGSAAWNGGLVLDADHDGRSDLFLLGSGKRPQLLLNRATSDPKDVDKWFEARTTNSPPLLQAVVADLDLDGWADVVGLSDKRLPVLLHNEAGRLVLHPEALGRAEDFEKDLIALTVLQRAAAAGTRSEDGASVFADVLVWSESKGLQLYVNQGNKHHGLQVAPSGRILIEPTGVRCRSNLDGVGTWVVAQAGDLWTGQEYTTLSAGLGQSRQPVLLGLGRFPTADVLRLRWPDNVWQAELNQAAGGPFIIPEKNRKTSSCPILFTWDGKRFVFVTDFLGAGSVGEQGPDGSTRPPRPEESVKIEADQLAPLDGHYVLKIAEPMDEVTYLDKLQLVVVDHPAGVRVYPDERFATADPQPTQHLVGFRREVFPVRATDHRGRDVTQKLRHRDRDTVNEFAHRTWLGFAEEHAVELDFGDRLAGFKPDERLFLCLAGWTDYAYPESIWAAHQAGVEILPPVLEKMGEDGKWHTLGEAGFPAGLPRMMTLELTGKLGGPTCRLRLRTNLQIYWDQAFIAVGCQTLPAPAAGERKQTDLFRATTLDVADASLTATGLMQEFSPDGRQPTVYDLDRQESVPVVRPAGKMTRRGDVTELLRDHDDRFVIFGPGDLVTVRFDAGSLPELPSGWVRSFVLRSWGYCKDTAPFTAHGDTIEPLPFAAMKNYPPGPDERYPDDALHRDYLRRFNTRQVQPDSPPLRSRR